MSIRGSRSADFIGGFRRYDYAVDIYTESYLLKLKQSILHFPIYEETISDRKFGILVRCLNELKAFMKSINNDTLESRITHLVFNPDLKNTKDFRKQLRSVQEDALNVLSKSKGKIQKKTILNSEIKFKSQISFLDVESLTKLDKNTLINYIKRVKRDYKSLQFKHINKPSLDHLFDAAERCDDKILRCKTIILLIQKDIIELELLDSKAAHRNKL
jgi:hypothetical protein